MFDKEKSCKDCPDRKVGCHSTCEGYLKRCKKRDEINAKKKEERGMYAYIAERRQRLDKIYHVYGARKIKKKY